MRATWGDGRHEYLPDRQLFELSEVVTQGPRTIEGAMELLVEHPAWPVRFSSQMQLSTSFANFGISGTIWYRYGTRPGEFCPLNGARVELLESGRVIDWTRALEPDGRFRFSDARRVPGLSMRVTLEQQNRDPTRPAAFRVTYQQPSPAGPVPFVETVDVDARAVEDPFVQNVILDDLAPPPAAHNPEFNIALRGWVPVDETPTLVDYDGDTDADPPYLGDLLPGGIGEPVRFTSTYQMRDWNYGSSWPGEPYPRRPFPVTLAGLATTPGQTVHLPGRRQEIDPNGARALVVYAERNRLTVKYTREEVVRQGASLIFSGYMVHLEGICVDPRLLELYQRLDAEGRRQLPALHNLQPFARAAGSQILVAVRDTGSFMDPRARKDWWRGRAWWARLNP